MGAMDPFVIIKALNVAILLLVGGALYVFWRNSNRTPFLLHWSLYEFALAVAVVVDGYILPLALAIGLAVPVLLLGISGYRNQRPPSRAAFFLMFLAVALPAYIAAEIAGRTYGLTYLAVAISVAYLATAALFFREGGALNVFVAAAFIGRTVSVLLYPLWEAWDVLYISYGVGQVFTLAAGIGMLMAGFAKAYNAVKEHEQELISAYNQSEELMLRLEQRNHEYLEARQSAEAANATKSQFLANMSHELRTPLNAILGFSEVLAVLPKDKALDKMSSYARNIHEAASGLQSIINDILNLSRVEAGALDVKQESCDLAEMFSDILRILKPLADQKDITLDNRSSLLCLARCDSRLTRQSLINGISNAIKYTQPGGTVICDAKIDGVDVVATVEDNGIGIDDARIARVFEPFWQEGNNMVAENEGVGLGLTIARAYVEAQGGHIEIERAGKRGTIFRVVLPVAERHKLHAATAEFTSSAVS